jgi:hypothetical protein|tara:strand:- start:389 stop:1051 length:663 start_codon:yes stop_codon:yes gene_type:complete
MDVLQGALNLVYLSQKRPNASTAKRGYNEEQWVASYIGNAFRINEDRRSKIDLTNGDIGIQVKKSKPGQFQQISRGTVDNLVTKLPDLECISDLLKERCEEKKLFNPDILEPLNKNKRILVEHALLGHGTKPDILCISEWDKRDTKRKKIMFASMENVVDSLMQYDFAIRKSRTVVELGPSFTIQRKGGDGGRKSANDVQFKIVPSLLDIIYPITIPLEQ